MANVFWKDTWDPFDMLLCGVISFNDDASIVRKTETRTVKKVDITSTPLLYFRRACHKCPVP